MSDDNCIQPRQEVCVELTARNQPGCSNIPVAPAPITTGAIAKIPIVLAELVLQVNVNATITLPEPVTEIKVIKKKLFLQQCLLLQNTNTLFLDGFVRKNIEYATRDLCSNAQGFCGAIRQCTVDVPFACATPITFNVAAPAPAIFNTSNEFEFLRTQPLGPEFSEKDTLESGNFTEFNQVTTEFFNELPFCELVSSAITEFDEFLNRIDVGVGEILFNTIQQKMVIAFTIKVLQNRQVTIPAI